MSDKRGSTRKLRKPTSGFTILEILIALAIISVLIGIAAPSLMGGFGRAKSTAAKIEMSNLKGALQLFYVDVGRYPTEAEGLEALFEHPSRLLSWNGPYVENAATLKDPWGRPYYYRTPGESSAFDLFTYGRDGYLGGSSEDADIKL